MLESIHQLLHLLQHPSLAAAVATTSSRHCLLHLLQQSHQVGVSPHKTRQAGHCPIKVIL